MGNTTSTTARATPVTGSGPAAKKRKANDGAAISADAAANASNLEVSAVKKAGQGQAGGQEAVTAREPDAILQEFLGKHEVFTSHVAHRVELMIRGEKLPTTPIEAELLKALQAQRSAYQEANLGAVGAKYDLRMEKEDHKRTLERLTGCKRQILEKDEAYKCRGEELKEAYRENLEEALDDAHTANLAANAKALADRESAVRRECQDQINGLQEQVRLLEHYIANNVARRESNLDRAVYNSGATPSSANSFNNMSYANMNNWASDVNQLNANVEGGVDTTSPSLESGLEMVSVGLGIAIDDEANVDNNNNEGRE